MRRVGNVSQAIGKGQLDGLDLTMVRQQRVALLKIKTLKNVERNQRHETVPVGRNLPDVVATVVHADGLAPVHLVGGQVVQRQLATRGLHAGGDLIGQRATVKTGSAGLGNVLQRVSMACRAPHLAGLRGTLRGKGVKPGFEVRGLELFAKQPSGLLPGIGHHGRNRKSVARQFHCSRHRGG